MKLLKSTTIIVVLVTLFSKISGFIREQVLAVFFGASNEADTFVTILSIPQYVTNIIGGIFLACLVPLYINIKEKQGFKVANQFTLNVLILTLGFILFINLVLFLGMEQISFVFFDDYSETIKLYLLTAIPIQSVMILSVMFQAILNANKNFNIPILSTIAMNMIFIIIIASFSSSVLTLLWSSLTSSTIQFAFLLIYTFRKKLLVIEKFSFYKDGVKEFLIMGLPMLIGSLAIQSYIVYDKVLARGLPEGSIAALNYSFKIAQLPVGIIAMGVSTVLLTSLSSLISKGEYKNANKKLFEALEISYLILLPIVMIIYLFSTNITSLLFERGAFDSKATIITAEALRGYSLGIIGLSLTMIMSRVFYANKNALIPVIGNVVAAVLNFLLALILVKEFLHTGLAWANSISTILNFVFLLVIYLTTKGKAFMTINYKPLLRPFMLTFITVTIIQIGDRFIVNEGFIQFMVTVVILVVLYLILTTIIYKDQIRSYLNK
ncbi:murein biosynthesis integral membrane protein MurJ [Alkalicoccobacillus gibsonii]|uniref:murein biosynthesis integral membrane protein MurJ n=1 Tax=Alkalicoccobacillus gibsonii TaxID=79881 RepID=UPI003513A6A3